MTLIPERTTRTSKSAFTKAAVGLALAGAAITGALYFSGSFSGASNDNPVRVDPMEAARKIVRDNQAKPCAANAAKISAILLSDPRLKCDGPNVIAP